MTRYHGTRYNSRWDAFTWSILFLTLLLSGWPILLPDDGIAPIVICSATFLFILVAFLSVYYRIDGNQLIVYQFFIPKSFPIDKIDTISPTRSALSAPAASLKHRIAITFTDRSVMKSNFPLIVSPVKQKEFIDTLISINPRIKLLPS